MTCPIKKFLSDCTDLSSYLDDVNEKIDYMELELKVLLSQSENGTEPSEAAVQLFADTKKMLDDERRDVRELREGNEHFDKFLRNMLDQVKAVYKETTEMEAYMADYGYVAPPPIDPIRFDIFREESPGAAADIPPEESEIKHKAEVTDVDVTEDFEVILFKLGLSKETFKLLTKTKKSDENLKVSKDTDCLENSSKAPNERNDLALDHLEVEPELTVNISPAKNLFPSSTSIPIRDVYTTEKVEISPGLYTKKKIHVKEPKSDAEVAKSPEEGDSEEVMKICNRILKENQKVDSPDFDIPDIGTPKRQTNQLDSSGCETPTLHTFNLREFLNNKKVEIPVSSQQSQEDFDPVFDRDTKELESGAITPEFNFNRDAKEDPETPETPEDIRALFAKYCK